MSVVPIFWPRGVSNTQFMVLHLICHTQHNVVIASDINPIRYFLPHIPRSHVQHDWLRNIRILLERKRFVGRNKVGRRCFWIDIAHKYPLVSDRELLTLQCAAHMALKTFSSPRSPGPITTSFTTSNATLTAHAVSRTPVRLLELCLVCRCGQPVNLIGWLYNCYRIIDRFTQIYCETEGGDSIRTGYKNVEVTIFWNYTGSPQRSTLPVGCVVFRI